MKIIKKGDESPQDGYLINEPEKEFLEIGKEFVSEYLQARDNVARKYLSKEHNCEGCEASCP